ncbi:MAG TPA: Arc family DNA-binding protein [Ktedonobacterales bacterium]|nr:Arc family DNA-binding protein [Ktedonobacterales bacterium]
MSTTQRPERPITIRFPLDVLETIRRLAKQHERSFNGEVVWALREYGARHPPEHQPEVDKETS